MASGRKTWGFVEHSFALTGVAMLGLIFFRRVDSLELNRSGNISNKYGGIVLQTLVLQTFYIDAALREAAHALPHLVYGRFTSILPCWGSGVPRLYYRGQRIWKVAIEDLLAKGMYKVKQALLSGRSAGGLASILHCDEFRELMPRSAVAKCLSDAGLFLDVMDVSGGYYLRSLFKGVVTLQYVLAVKMLIWESIMIFISKAFQKEGAAKVKFYLLKPKVFFFFQTLM